MKQRITVDQLKELTESQRNAIRQLWEPIKGDVFCCVSEGKELLLSYVGDGISDDVLVHIDYICGEVPYNKEDCLPLLSIGEMLAILEQEDFITVKLNGPDWEIWLYDDYEQGCGNELCDALFQAVKKIIKI